MQFNQNIVRGADVLILFQPDEDIALSRSLQGKVSPYFWQPSIFFYFPISLFCRQVNNK